MNGDAPEKNPLIPMLDDDDAPFNPLIAEHAELDPAALAEELEASGAGEADLGGGLRVEAAGPRARGLLVFRDGTLVSNLAELNVAELRRIRRHLRGR